MASGTNSCLIAENYIPVL